MGGKLKKNKNNYLYYTMCICDGRCNIINWIYNIFHKAPSNKPVLFLDEERGIVYYYNLPTDYIDE